MKRINNNHIIGIVKVFREEAFRNSFIRGELYMNHLHKFIVEGNEQQKDEHEAISMYKPIRTMFGNCNLQTRDAMDEYKPIYCMYAIKECDIKDSKIQLSEIMREFGDYAVLITEPEKFLTNVRDNNPNMEIALIHYLDMEVFDRTTILSNPVTFKLAEKDYKYQQELRFYEPLTVCCKDDSISDDYAGLVKDNHIIRKYTPMDIGIKLYKTDDLIKGIEMPLEMKKALDNTNLLESNFDLSTDEGWKKNSILAKVSY